MMSRTERRGSALILVLISSIFLLILTGAAYQFLKTNADTQVWTQDRIQAKLSAEAGMNLATHMLVAGASLPTEGEPVPLLGEEGDPFELPGGMGSVYVTADPSLHNATEIMSNAFMLRCIAWPPGTSIETFGIETIVMPENLARFSVFMDEPTLGGYYGDGYRFDGPFYANGPVRVYSESNTHENDVFFYSFSLTSDYYIYGTGGTTQATTPAYGKLEMRPYERLSMGAPYFELGVDPIPFGPTELNWQGVRNAAQSGGLVLDLPDMSRIAVKGDTLMVQRDTGSPVERYPLGTMDNPVVWIDNSSTESVLIRGHQLQGLNMALTIGALGSFYMSGPLHYANPDPQDPDNHCLLGLMSVYGDMVIADHPLNPDTAWDGECFSINTDSTFQFSSVLVALDGDLYAEKYWEPDPQQEFQLIGGYMIQEEGYTGMGGPHPKGFTIGVYFDPRLLFMHPPFFPTTANWKTIMWEEWPDMEPSDVTQGDPFW